jgi:hypothetical protein
MNMAQDRFDPMILGFMVEKAQSAMAAFNDAAVDPYQHKIDELQNRIEQLKQLETAQQQSGVDQKAQKRKIADIICLQSFVLYLKKPGFRKYGHQAMLPKNALRDNPVTEKELIEAMEEFGKNFDEQDIGGFLDKVADVSGRAGNLIHREDAVQLKQIHKRCYEQAKKVMENDLPWVHITNDEQYFIDDVLQKVRSALGNARQAALAEYNKGGSVVNLQAERKDLERQVTAARHDRSDALLEMVRAVNKTYDATELLVRSECDLPIDMADHLSQLNAALSNTFARVVDRQELEPPQSKLWQKVEALKWDIATRYTNVRDWVSLYR